MEENLAYTTEEREKMEVMDKVEQLNGDIETAIRQLAEQKREIIRKEESGQT